jgi:hypothetical protein
VDIERDQISLKQLAEVLSVIATEALVLKDALREYSDSTEKNTFYAFIYAGSKDRILS